MVRRLWGGRGDRADDRAGDRVRAGGVGRPSKGSRLHRTRRARARRWASAGLVAVAAFMTLAVLRPPAAVGSGEPTVVAVRALAAGAVVGPADVRVERRPVAQRPVGSASSVDEVVGRRAAGPVSEREVLTAARLVGPGLLDGQPSGHVALTLPVLGASGAGAAAGMRVDVYATGTGTLVARDVVVLAVGGVGAVGGSGGGSGVGAGGGLLSAGSGATDGGGGGPAEVTLAMGSAEAATVARHLSALSAGESFVLALRA